MARKDKLKKNEFITSKAPIPSNVELEFFESKIILHKMFYVF